MDSNYSDNDSCNDHTERCKLIENQNLIETDAMYHHTLNNSSDNSVENDNRGAKRSNANNEYLFISSQGSRQFQNRFFKQFIVIFSFATLFIILLQLYLTFYYDDPMNRGTIFSL